MKRWSNQALLLHGATAGVVSGGLCALILDGGKVPGWAVLIPVTMGFLYVAFKVRRYLRRLSAGDEPSKEVTRTLEKKVSFYKKLPSDEQARFRREVHWFLLDQTITGVGEEVTDELRALVAASAVVLSFGMPNYEWDNTRDILLYVTAFTEDYQQGHSATRLGQVSRQGPVIFSAKALRQGFAHSNDGHNVGFHEFAHVLDFEDGEADGILAHLNWEAVRPWVDQMTTHMKRREAGKRRTRQVLRNYAYTHEAEFLACSTEMFFEQPTLLRRRAPELYKLMRDFYGQDLHKER